MPVGRHKTMQSDRMTYYRQFQSLVTRHKALIEHFCKLRAYGDKRLCAELQQECYLWLWRRADRLKPGAAPLQETAWVYWQCRAAYSNFSYYRKAWKLLPLDGWMADNIAEPVDNGARDCIEAMADELTDHERRAFLLMADGFDDDEIAQQLNIKQRSVVQLRYRIINELRKKYKK